MRNAESIIFGDLPTMCRDYFPFPFSEDQIEGRQIDREQAVEGEKESVGKDRKHRKKVEDLWGYKAERNKREGVPYCAYKTGPPRLILDKGVSETEYNNKKTQTWRTKKGDKGRTCPDLI